jgi:iron complex transport system substrate-binding protein
MRYKEWLIACLVAVTLLAGCGRNDNAGREGKYPEQRVIVDMTGKQVTLPPNITRIADMWPAHHDILCILGAGDKIVATVTYAKKPWMYKVNPQMRQATTVSDLSSVDIERLLKTKPDIAFMPLTDKNASLVADLGIPTVQMYFHDFASLKETVRMTGVVLGEEAVRRAEEYNTYLDGKLGRITGITAKIPQTEKPKVLHITSLMPLTVDGRDTIMNAWIDVAGGINVATDLRGLSQEVSLETIVKWNPDIIIIGNAAGTVKKGGGKTGIEEIPQDEVWRQIAAVKNGKVCINPEGVFLWDRLGAEEALQIQWAAKLLHPDKFADLDMVQETRYFFRKFYNYDLSEAEAYAILAGQAPIP